jgi:hypothetical protein
MPSILHTKVVEFQSKADEIRYHAAELAAHNAAIAIRDALRQYLPRHLRPFAESIAMTGLFSAYGRIGAEILSPALSDQLLDHIEGAVEEELEHWRQHFTRH